MRQSFGAHILIIRTNVIMAGMRISVLSDLHLEFEPYTPADVKADVIVLAGDIHVGVKGIRWAQATFGGSPVIYVAGNHEYYRQSYPDRLTQMRETAQGTNVRFLENDSTEIDGVVFLGCTLWTDFKLFGDSRNAMHEAEAQMNDYRLIRVSPQYRRLRPTDTLLVNAKSVDWLKRTTVQHQDKPLVVVTHHAPSILSIQERYKEDVVSAAFASPLDELVASSRAKLWVHGHVHDAARYTIGETQVLCNPRGYPGESTGGFDPTLT